ncbi:hypothetical protein K501DRAFT_266022 [Backusella circina FSU 941]|nr:hypothetical protein K501DRAFT_266022 [Backusella circina FSU 941]
MFDYFDRSLKESIILGIIIVNKSCIGMTVFMSNSFRSYLSIHYLLVQWKGYLWRSFKYQHYEDKYLQIVAELIKQPRGKGRINGVGEQYGHLQNYEQLYLDLELFYASLLCTITYLDESL